MAQIAAMATSHQASIDNFASPENLLETLIRASCKKDIAQQSPSGMNQRISIRFRLTRDTLNTRKPRKRRSVPWWCSEGLIIPPSSSSFAILLCSAPLHFLGFSTLLLHFHKVFNLLLLLHGRCVYDAFRRSLDNKVVELNGMQIYQLSEAKENEISPCADTRLYFEPVSGVQSDVIKMECEDAA
jgi:hypothetical protein